VSNPSDPIPLDAAAAAGPSDVRLVVVDEESSHPLVDTTGDDWLMTVPHLIQREIAAFRLLLASYAIISFLWDAPLLDIADPTTTPNPAKAPWYFLGLQELLHYYSPFVSGVVIPGLAVVALLVIPYFDVNVERAPFLTRGHFGRHLAGVWLVSLAAGALLATTSGAGPVWPLLGTTLVLAVAMTLPVVLGRRRGLGAWLATRSLPFWVFTWFVTSWIVLTIIGTLFRGPGWSFVLPWEVGIYD